MNGEITGPVTITYWCGVCNSEPATMEIEVDIFNDGKFVPLWVGQDCLTRAEDEGKIEA